MKKDLKINLAEDLIGEDESTQIYKRQKMKKHISHSQIIASIGSSNIQDLIMEVAKILAIPMDELQEWAKESSLPDELLKAILRIAKRFKLNPVFEHIAWERNAEGGYEAYIPIDGWIALIHRKQSFQGLIFHQSTETENGIPIWMECTIYRSDLPHPITVREYYVELKTDHPMWQSMPHRMLRHKTLQQCARLAFGINVPEIYKAEFESNRSGSNFYTKENNLQIAKNLLKQKLHIK